MVRIGPPKQRPHPRPAGCPLPPAQALLGIAIFGETLPLLWFAGASCIITGVALLASDAAQSPANVTVDATVTSATPPRGGLVPLAIPADGQVDAGRWAPRRSPRLLSKALAARAHAMEGFPRADDDAAATAVEAKTTPGRGRSRSQSRGRGQASITSTPGPASGLRHRKG